MEGSEHKAKAGGNLGVPLAPAGTDPRGFRALWLSSLAWACVCVCVYMWVCFGGPLVLPPSCASGGAAAQGWGAVGDVGPVLGGSLHPKPCTGSCSGQGDVRAVGFVQHVLVSPDLTPRSWRVEVTVLAPSWPPGRGC